MDEKLKRLTNQQRVVLFMKGSPADPQCGFSAKIVALIEKHLKRSEYAYFDIF
jgi:glutaredoxin-related protein